VFFGSCAAMHRPTHTRAVNTTYVKFPPRTLLFREKAKSDAAAAGATVLWIETIVWARPFVAPRERLLGAEEDTYIKTEPNEEFRKQVSAMGYVLCGLSGNLLKPMSAMAIEESWRMMSITSKLAPPYT
jgi:hypothetical protein